MHSDGFCLVSLANQETIVELVAFAKRVSCIMDVATATDMPSLVEDEEPLESATRYG